MDEFGKLGRRGLYCKNDKNYNLKNSSATKYHKPDYIVHKNETLILSKYYSLSERFNSDIACILVWSQLFSSVLIELGPNNLVKIV